MRFWVFVAILVFGRFPTQAANLVGDADNSGIFEMGDASLAQGYLMGSLGPNQMSPLALADGDGDLDLTDLLLLSHAANGITMLSGPGALLALSHFGDPTLVDGAAPYPVVFDIASNYPSATKVDGLEVSIAMTPGESSLSGASTNVASDQATALFIPLNVAAPDDLYTIDAQIVVRNSDDSATLETVLDTMTVTVSPAACGDGVVNGAEVCDDGAQPGITLPPVTVDSACAPFVTTNDACSSNDPPTAGGTVTVSGNVDDISLLGVPDVLVEAIGLGISDTTDPAGDFALVGLPDNTRVDLRFSKFGYVTEIAYRLFTGTADINNISIPLYDDATFAILGSMGGMNQQVDKELVQFTLQDCFDQFMANYTIRLYHSSSGGSIVYADNNGLPDPFECPANSFGSVFAANVAPGPFVIEALGTGGTVIARTPVLTAEAGAFGLLGLRAGEIAPLTPGPVSCDGCAADCSRLDNLCGDLISECMEPCDTGGVDDPACDADCTLALCGDYYANAAAGEECDEGYSNTIDCDGDCTFVECGDMIINTVAGEECELIGGMEDPGCDADCTFPVCGDGYVNVEWPEVCDDGVNNGVCGYCDVDCFNTLICGDGDIDVGCGEICDQGPLNGSGPGFCLADCSGIAP